MLWGGPAQKKQVLVDEGKHLILKCNHPSPLAALKPPIPFIGSAHFAKANDWLTQRGHHPIIQWGKNF